MPQLILDNAYITDPTRIIKGKDGGGNLHYDIAYTPAPTDAVFDSQGKTLTQNLADMAGQLQLTESVDFSVCSTDGATAAKTADADGFILEDGKDISILFAEPNTSASATLNVAGTGAYPILYKGRPLINVGVSGLQRLTYYNGAWNIEGDLDTNVDTTYDVLTVAEAIAGTATDPRTVRADYLQQAVSQISQKIINSAMSGYDLSDLQAKLANLIFQLMSLGIIGSGGIDTIVTIEAATDINLISGIFANGRVYI